MDQLLQSVTFADLGLSPEILITLQKRGFTHPTPIQAKVIPIILQDKGDVVGQAQTGTGKTAAFALPLIEKLNHQKRVPQVLVLAPTRELAQQVAKEIESFQGSRPFRTAVLCGGKSITDQKRALKAGAQVVVGTPGRILDFLNQKALHLDQITHLVLDEADEMLNMGFWEDVEAILSYTPADKRMLLFSATMPPRILGMVQQQMNQLKIVKVTPEKIGTELVDQTFYKIKSGERKLDVLCRLLDSAEDFYGLIFCNMKSEVDQLNQQLEERGKKVLALHGDFSQQQRERILDLFKKKKYNILVATDVAARGIDIPELTHVVNYSLPKQAETYVHRIGRTGRNGKEGKSISFVTFDDMQRLNLIKRITKSNIRQELPPTLAKVWSLKRERMKRDLLLLLQGMQLPQSPDVQPSILQLSTELLEGQNPLQVTAALLQYFLPSGVVHEAPAELEVELDLQDDEDNYFNRKKTQRRGASPRERERGSESRGRERESDRRSPRVSQEQLVSFTLTEGKSQGMSPRKMLKIICQKTRLPFESIHGIKILETASSFMVSSQDAQVVHKFFPIQTVPSKKKKVAVS